MMETIQAGDQTATGYLALPASGTGPGVLVLHAWWGLTEVFTGVCDRLAEAGFVAFAPDLYDGRTTASIDEAKTLMEQSDSARMQAVAVASVLHLRAHPAVSAATLGAIGFSLGASWAFALSSMEPDSFAAIVAFYSTGEADFAAARAAYLGHYAEHDEFEPLDGVHASEAQIRAAGREVTFHVYPNTGHWFFEQNRPDAYDAAAAQLAWERTVAFLHRRLG